MKKNKTKEIGMSLVYIFILLICRGTYLYFGERKTPQQSLIQVGIEVGNFAIIAMFAFLIAFIFLYIGAKYRRKTMNNASSKKK